MTPGHRTSASTTDRLTAANEKSDIAQATDVSRACVAAGVHPGPGRPWTSGHSWSDVDVTTGYLIRPEKLDRVLELELEVLREGIDAGGLFCVEAGVRLREHGRVRRVLASARPWPQRTSFSPGLCRAGGLAADQAKGPVPAKR